MFVCWGGIGPDGDDKCYFVCVTCVFTYRVSALFGHMKVTKVCGGCVVVNVCVCE